MSALSKTTPYHTKSYTDGFFNVNGRHGFLPVSDPMSELPERYIALQQLMLDLPTHKDYSAKTPSVLASSGEIVNRVAALPDYREKSVRGTELATQICQFPA